MTTLERANDASPGLRPDDASFDISDETDVRALLAAEDAHFWHRARNRVIRDKIAALGVHPGARVLELGCGAGCVSADLARAGYDVTGVDGHPSLLGVACTRAPQARFFCHDLRLEMADHIERAAFDVVGLFDVIEHLDDPVKALARAVGFAKPGGFVVGTVPALMALWSSIDEHAGHKTRYSEPALRAVLGAVDGARVLSIAPFFRALVPLVWMQRRMLDRTPEADRRSHVAASVQNLQVPMPPLNAALLAVTTVEHALAPILQRVPLPGASLWFALGR